MNKFFNAFHIGGRGGSISFKNNIYFEHMVQNSIFDADEDSEEVIRLKNPNAKIYSICLDEKKRLRKFFLNKNRYTSSFLEPHHNNLNFYQDINGKNMLLSDACEKEKIIEVQTFSLDELKINKKIDNIDFISLDTQGSELDILKGAKNCLTQTIIAIQLEVSLIDFYKEGTTFFLADNFLKENNFLLYSFEPLNVNFFGNIPSDFIKKKFPSQAEVLYILDYRSITNDAKLEKLGFFCLLYGYTDIAYQIINSLKYKNYKFYSDKQYLNFINEFHKLVKAPDMTKFENDEIYDYSKNIILKDNITKIFPEYYKYNPLKKFLILLIYDRKSLVNKLTNKFRRKKKRKLDVQFEKFLRKYNIT